MRARPSAYEPGDEARPIHLHAQPRLKPTKKVWPRTVEVKGSRQENPPRGRHWGEQRTDPPLAQALFDGFCIDQVELAFARTSILVKYLVPLLPAQPSAVSVENYSVAMSLVLAAEEPVSTAPRDIFPHVCDGAFFPHVCVGATATMLCLLLSSPLDL